MRYVGPEIEDRGRFLPNGRLVDGLSLTAEGSLSSMLDPPELISWMCIFARVTKRGEMRRRGVTITKRKRTTSSDGANLPLSKFFASAFRHKSVVCLENSRGHDHAILRWRARSAPGAFGLLPAGDFKLNGTQSLLVSSRYQIDRSQELQVIRFCDTSLTADTSW